MNDFSKITGLIAFWTRVVVFVGTILILVFQKQIMKAFYSPTLDVTVFLFDEVFIRFVLLLIVGLFCFRKNMDNRTRAVISLYFYLFVTMLFSNPIVTSFSVMLTGTQGSEYLAAKSIVSSALQSILYVFVFAGNVCFYLSAGTSIFLNGSRNEENENDASEKSRTKLVLLSGFLGMFGIDRFYAGRIGMGIVKFLLGLPISISVIFLSFRLISNGFSDILPSLMMTFRFFAFAFNQSESLPPSVLIATIPFLPITILSVADFVLCASGKIKTSDGKLISKW